MRVSARSLSTTFRQGKSRPRTSDQQAAAPSCFNCVFLLLVAEPSFTEGNWRSSGRNAIGRPEGFHRPPMRRVLATAERPRCKPVAVGPERACASSRETPSQRCAAGMAPLCENTSPVLAASLCAPLRCRAVNAGCRSGLRVVPPRASTAQNSPNSGVQRTALTRLSNTSFTRSGGIGDRFERYTAMGHDVGEVEARTLEEPLGSEALTHQVVGQLSKPSPAKDAVARRAGS